MGAARNGSVLVGDTWYGPEDDMPEDVAAQVGEHAFHRGKHPYPEARAAFVAKRDGLEEKQQETPQQERPEGTPPPKQGTGSGRDNWLAYADEIDVEVPKGTTRDAIIQLITDAGKPVEAAPGQ